MIARPCALAASSGVQGRRPSNDLLSVSVAVATEHLMLCSPVGDGEARGERPHLTRGALRHPGAAAGGSHQRARGATGPAGYAFSTAPSGSTPVSRYGHSSISSWRASATIPIRRTRLLPCPKRA